MGTPWFAVPIVDALVMSGHSVTAVVTQPDRPKGRGRKLAPPPVKSFALEHGLTVLQPENINRDEDVICRLGALSPDVIVTAAFGQIVSRRILSIPMYGCVNVHTSLLPKYRGAAPINRAIINGEDETGVTIIRMTELMDAGDIVAQRAIKISVDEDAGSLEERLSGVAADLLIKVIDSFGANTIEYRPQDERSVTFANKLDKREGAIDWSCNGREIHNLVRGLVPWPCAYSFLKRSGNDERKRVIIKKTCVDDVCKVVSGNPPGTIDDITERGLLVAVGDGSVCVSRLQPEGKREMEVKDFVNGCKVGIGDVFLP